MGVGALGVVNRGVVSEIAPNHGDHLECDECGACIDICPVGALTSGTYRYKTRPWEMKHVGTICTHCSNGCKTTLGVRNGQIIRGNNRDQSGINGEFLCIKGRYAFDFDDHPERLQSPLMQVNGELQAVSWSRGAEALSQTSSMQVESGERQVRRHRIQPYDQRRELLLQKFAREVLKTNNIDHHRTGDLATLLRCVERPDRRAGDGGGSVQDQGRAGYRRGSGAAASAARVPAAGELPASSRHRCYTVTEGPVRERKYAKMTRIVEPARQLEEVEVAAGRARGGRPSWSFCSAIPSRATGSGGWSLLAIRWVFR